MALPKKPEIKTEKNEVKVFVNWAIETPSGTLSSSRGLPIFQNPEYVNDEENVLIDAVQQAGGMLELTMQVRICSNRQAENKKISASDLLPLKAAV